jgi:hypothetical protein
LRQIAAAKTRFQVSGWQKPKSQQKNEFNFTDNVLVKALISAVAAGRYSSI